jgi:predicted protein tyrosine phosphatase
MNILFVCTVNRMRSCTAETIYGNNPKYRVRSAGIASTASRQLTEELLRWADKVIVMENMHRDFIISNFPDIDLKGRLIVLGIPDFYYYMEPELVELLRNKIDPLLDDLR